MCSSDLYAEDQMFPPPATGFTAPSLPRLPSTSSSFAQILLRRDATTGAVYRVTLDANGNESAVSTDSYDSVFNAASQDGWYFEFPSAGEQLISSPTGRRNFVAFTSVRPVSTSDASCSADPMGTLYAVNAATGLPPRGLLSTIVVNGVTTYVYAAKVQDQVITVVGDSSSPSSASGQTSCGPGKIRARFLGQKTDENGCVEALNMRLQWREISGMKTQ